MKILLVLRGLQPEFQNDMAELYKAMSRKKHHDVFVLTDADLAMFPNDSTDMATFPNNDTEMATLPKDDEHIWYIYSGRAIEFLRVLGAIRRERFDRIVFCDLQWRNRLTQRYAKTTDSLQIIPEGRRAYNWLERMLLRSAPVIFCRSEEQMRHIKDLVPAFAERIHVLEPWRTFLPYTEPVFSKKVLCIGKLSHDINAIKNAVQKQPTIQFRIIALDDRTNKDAMIQLGKEPNVVFTFAHLSRAEIDRAYYECDWVMLPFSSDSQRTLILEAYAHSRPVIAFNAGTTEELVDDGKSGFLIPNKDADEFAMMIGYVIGMPRSLYEGHCRYAYCYGREKFDSEAAAEKILFMPESTEGVDPGQTTAMKQDIAVNSKRENNM